ncbi:hypothetical protein RFI_02556 [Reticulomyxa filosa]|uniref:TH1 domain-containing protein n=1 Tax=Reticulomyxa filosa TaxID=46433 RepID=X6P7P4_RETFI|nr:hypothetical protein RFI_02556 [Reticulomyxa filosa]|eukprot:ETO34540.1 hypothetical protein RFI_02556 [Reticulomyxa filosa]
MTTVIGRIIEVLSYLCFFDIYYNIVVTEERFQHFAFTRKGESKIRILAKMSHQSNSENKHDILGIEHSSQLLSLFKKEGEENEYLILSEKLIKINRKGKKQERVLIITNKAIYNTKIGKYNKSQRRIQITDLAMITVSTTSHEFVLHVPSEYDYHLCSSNSAAIVEKLTKLYNKQTNAELLIVKSDLQHLKDVKLLYLFISGVICVGQYNIDIFCLLFIVRFLFCLFVIDSLFASE